MHSRRNGEVVLPPPLFAEAEREAELFKEKMLQKERNGGDEDGEEDDSGEEEEEIETTQPLDAGNKENTIDEANSGPGRVFSPCHRAS